MSFPRILILGQEFNTYSGGGITQSNLFKGWPREKIAVVAAAQQLANVSTETCSTYYQLGSDEYIWKFPFSLFMPYYPSGLKLIDSNTTLNLTQSNSGIRYLLVNKIFGPFVRWTGLFFVASKINLSSKLQEWLSIFQPEVLYIQVSNREGISFAKHLCKYLNIPSVIHIMDDWPSIISNKGLFKNYWNRKIDAEFRQLLDLVDLHLSISDAMTSEYWIRYHKRFFAFHNPIETEIWQKCSKSNFEIDESNISVLYAGRIGIGVTSSLIEVASAIDEMREKGQKITLYIQTPTTDFRILNRLRKHDCIVINPATEYDQMPKIFSSADILLFANEFSKKGIAFLKLSIPTKLSEYMVSGTPIFVYGPKESAAIKIFFENECGFCVSEQNKNAIIEGLKYLIHDQNYRMKISRKSIDLANEKFEAKKVKTRFHLLLSRMSEKAKETKC